MGKELRIWIIFSYNIKRIDYLIFEYRLFKNIRSVTLQTICGVDDNLFPSCEMFSGKLKNTKKHIIINVGTFIYLNVTYLYKIWMNGVPVLVCCSLIRFHSK